MSCSQTEEQKPRRVKEHILTDLRYSSGLALLQWLLAHSRFGESGQTAKLVNSVHPYELPLELYGDTLGNCSK